MPTNEGIEFLEIFSGATVGDLCECVTCLLQSRVICYIYLSPAM